MQRYHVIIQEDINFEVIYSESHISAVFSSKWGWPNLVSRAMVQLLVLGLQDMASHLEAGNAEAVSRLAVAAVDAITFNLPAIVVGHNASCSLTRCQFLFRLATLCQL